MCIISRIAILNCELIDCWEFAFTEVAVTVGLLALLFGVKLFGVVDDSSGWIAIKDSKSKASLVASAVLY